MVKGPAPALPEVFPVALSCTLQTAFKAYLECYATEEAKECVASARGCGIRPSQS